MLFSSSVVSAFMMLSGVSALPQPDEGGLMGRASPSPCPAGSYRYNTTACAYCPAGSYCDGTSGQAKLCSPGFYQPNINSTACLGTPKGYYTNSQGNAAATPCPAGTYQPNTIQVGCNGAPSGRFQSLPGQACVCLTCSGWGAPLKNNNINPVNCSGSTPNSYPGSGDGCLSKTTNGYHAATCQQDANGACPIDPSGTNLTICG
ncbi:hypothetical protein GGX14DRAFT_561729 [Mycena pura]|uniref:Uncharacterized protein n=1 Tax=Mycena pura TaxID=153505 RepID=A0AAD6VMB6_9AGAR|nr:hypothetical protein GGX14DRAFT_561729 [Mycena pura]